MPSKNDGELGFAIGLRIKTKMVCMCRRAVFLIDRETPHANQEPGPRANESSSRTPAGYAAMLMSLSPELTLALIRAACLALIPAEAARPPFAPANFPSFITG